MQFAQVGGRRTRWLVAALVALVLTPTGALASSPALTLPQAKHALSADLARGFGIHRVHATCKRRSREKFSCSWSGRRGRTRYHGRATVMRGGRSIVVQLTGVHKG